MLITPSIFLLYFPQRQTAAMQASFNTVTAPVPPAAFKATLTTLNNSPSCAANAGPSTHPKTPSASALSSAALPKSVQSCNALTASHAERDESTPREVRLSHLNTFSSMNQHMVHLEQSFTERILHLESERDEQQRTIQVLTEKMDRFITTLNSTSGAPISMLINDPIQAPPLNGALPPPPQGQQFCLQHQP